MTLTWNTFFHFKLCKTSPFRIANSIRMNDIPLDLSNFHTNSSFQPSLFLFASSFRKFGLFCLSLGSTLACFQCVEKVQANEWNKLVDKLECVTKVTTVQIGGSLWLNCPLMGEEIVLKLALLR